jgi:hypothetical protein
MTPNEIITAGISALALIVAGLALIYSRRSADAAQKSAEAAQRANDLMARQLDLAMEERKLKLQKERSESYPFFNWRGGSCVPAAGQCDWDFQNLGAMVTDLKINSETKGISASISPTNALLTNGQGKIIFGFEKMISQNLALPVVFTISCLTKLGEQWTKRFEMVGVRFPERIVET